MDRSAHSQQVNDWLQAGAAAEDDPLDLLCECGSSDCRATVSTTRERYLLAREGVDQLVVVAGHEAPAQRVVHAWDDVLVVAPPRPVRAGAAVS